MSKLSVLERLILVTALVCPTLSFSQNTSSLNPDSHLLPSPRPDRIILNLSENPLEAIHVNWRTDTTRVISHLEVAQATAGPEFRDKTTQLKAVTEMLVSQQDEEPTIQANYHQVKLTGLEPGSSYVYRVGGFGAGQWIHASIPSMMTPGNHEFSKNPATLTPHWNAQFNLPTNGPKGLEETTYEVNFPELKIISLDGEQIDESPEYRKAQMDWLRAVLTDNPRKWTVITFHYPVYATHPNRYHDKMIDYIRPILQEFKVDLAIQGHDHAYARGRAFEENGKLDYGKGTVYVVSVGGPKMYEVKSDEWMARKAYGTQTYQWIKVKDNILSFKTYTALGELYDSFEIHKNPQGENTLVNNIPNTPERLQNK